jgi:hypothetical protein
MENKTNLELHAALKDLAKRATDRIKAAPKLSDYVLPDSTLPQRPEPATQK